MMRPPKAAALVPLLLACDDGASPTPFTPTLDAAICAPTAGPFSSTITNPYFPMLVGSEWVLSGSESGETVEVRITALDETADVAGVTTRVVEERETVAGALVEVSRNFFAQLGDGTVCYYGEDVDIYQGGVIVSHSGAWRAGVGGASPGIFMPGAPAVGQAYLQEVAPGIAEDRAEITAIGISVTVPLGTYTETLRVRETSPLEPGSRSVKVYAHSVGPLVDDIVRLTARTP